MTTRELYKKLSSLRTSIAQEVGSDNNVVRLLSLSAKVLDAVAVRYPNKSIGDAIDELHDRSYEEWKEEQGANH
tara:strand:+ start:3581 stop:3802 length:222 start_codon:yes stop_codon:yes gene_type:complete